MKRTVVLQEIRQMRFEEAYEGWQEGRLSQEEAARILGICDRSFRRYRDRYEEQGMEGLLDKRLNQVSHRRAAVDEVMALTEKYRGGYEGWNAQHFHTWYRRAGIEPMIYRFKVVKSEFLEIVRIQQNTITSR